MNLQGGVILRQAKKEGKHYAFDDIEFWACDGVICIVDTRNGDINAVTCKEFALRARDINDEARKATYAYDKRRLQNLVISMHEVWKEAKEQGDPADPAVIKQRLRDRKLTRPIQW